MDRNCDGDGTEIIVNAEALSADSPPGKLVGRGHQVAQLQACLRPMLRGAAPINAWLTGPPGSGKSAVAHHVSEHVCGGHAPRVAVTVDCRRHRTLYGVCQAIIDARRILGAEAHDTAVKLDRIRQALRTRPAAIILDAIDWPLPTRRQEILCGLLSLPKTGLACIAASTRPLAGLDRPLRSRLNPAAVAFQRYSDAELTAILADRARRGLNAESWSPATLERIAAAADGDARRAISLLRRAAAAAEGAGQSKLMARTLRPLLRQTRQLHDQSRRANLNPHEHLIAHLAARHGPLSGPHLARRYVSRCRQERMPPVAPRTFRKYVAHLAAAGVVKVNPCPTVPGGRMIGASTERPACAPTTARHGIAGPS